MYKEENEHDQDHWHRVENVKHELMRDDPTRVTLNELDDADRVTDQNQDADNVKRVHVSFPGCSRLERCRSRPPDYAFVEYHSDDHEVAEDKNLERQPSNDSPAADSCEDGLVDCLEGSALSLDQEADDIASDKGLCESSGSYHGVYLCLGCAHDPTENHVYCCCEEYRRKQDE